MWENLAKEEVWLELDIEGHVGLCQLVMGEVVGR